MTGPIRVFIIEDDANMMQLLGDFIHAKFPDFIITKFTSGEEALRELSLNPQVIILDHYLNRENTVLLDGLAVLSKIRAQNKSCRIIFFSAQENPDVAANAIKMGAYDYIVKDEKAFAKIEALLGHYKKHLSLDNKAIVKKLYVVLFIGILLALLIYTIGRIMNN